MSKFNKKRNVIDYICSDCEKCLFFSVYTGMSATEYLCKAHKPYDFFNVHVMRRLTVYDYAIDDELRKIYFRKCNEFVSQSTVIFEYLNKIKRK